jgi:hypothetical protein
MNKLGVIRSDVTPPLDDEEKRKRKKAASADSSVTDTCPRKNLAEVVADSVIENRKQATCHSSA